MFNKNITSKFSDEQLFFLFFISRESKNEKSKQNMTKKKSTLTKQFRFNNEIIYKICAETKDSARHCRAAKKKKERPYHIEYLLELKFIRPRMSGKIQFWLDRVPASSIYSSS